MESNKPVQEVPDEIRKIISVVEEKKLYGRVSFVNFLLDYAPETRSQLVETIHYLLKRQREIGRMFPAFSNGDVMYGCFVKQNGIKEFS